VGALLGEHVAVADAEEALERLERGGGFDAVFSDVVMPGMGGIALAKE
jgi:CheY-like chemotaxis protein